MTDKISVVIPCYNAQATITSTLDSVLAQDIDRQIVVVDDGSTDDTAEILRGYGSRIEAIFSPNQGVSAARNRGLTAAAGDWIQFLDADDILMPGALARRLAQSENNDVVISDWREFTEDAQGRRDGALRRVDLAALACDPQRATATHVWAPPAAMVYRRTLVDKIGGFRTDLPVIEDARFLFDAAFHGARFAHVDHVGAAYRIAEGSLSRRDPGQFWRYVLLNGQQIEVLWRTHGGLSADYASALAGIYNQAARGLFSAGDPAFFEAAKELRRLGALPRHAAIAAPLARTLGLKPARLLLSLIGRG